MSAVSAEFPHASANAAPSGTGPDSSGGESTADRSGGAHDADGPRTGDGSLATKPAQPDRPGTMQTSGTDFGPNEWLVDELYQRYQADPDSVDRAWWNFFADYRPPGAAAP